MTEPLPTAAEIRRRIGDDELWSGIVDRPLDGLLRSALHTDLVRGIALTDGLIGTFARADQADLQQNRCFLYHVIGGGTGDWDVPIGGMGAVTAELERAARDAGAELRSGSPVTAVTPDGEVSIGGDSPETLRGRLVLSGVGATTLDGLLGEHTTDAPAPEGAQVKINMLLRRFPRLRDDRVGAEAAFAGTFHVNESMTQLDDAYDRAAGGGIPEPLPAEIYCHSLTDPSILGDDLRRSGAQTLTLFGLQVPHRLLDGSDPDATRTALLEAASRSLDSVLAESIADCLFEAPDGTACIEARTTADLEDSLGLVAGDIFHGPLSWPWTDTDAEPAGPARRWGVETAHPDILLCGSSARRGGAVSGIGGHNAAMAAVEILGD
jgi:phytoene dehydrogenase-like protein